MLNDVAGRIWTKVGNPQVVNIGGFSMLRTLPNVDYIETAPGSYMDLVRNAGDQTNDKISMDMFFSISAPLAVNTFVPIFRYGFRGNTNDSHRAELVLCRPARGGTTDPAYRFIIRRIGSNTVLPDNSPDGILDIPSNEIVPGVRYHLGFLYDAPNTANADMLLFNGTLKSIFNRGDLFYNVNGPRHLPFALGCSLVNTFSLVVMPDGVSRVQTVTSANLYLDGFRLVRGKNMYNLIGTEPLGTPYVIPSVPLNPDLF